MTTTLLPDAGTYGSDTHEVSVLSQQLLTRCEAVRHPHLSHSVPQLVRLMLDTDRWLVEHRAIHVRHALDDACAAVCEGDMHVGRASIIDELVHEVIEHLEAMRHDRCRYKASAQPMATSYWVG